MEMCMSFKRIPLPILNDPSLEVFNEFLNKNQPVLIKNALHWKLMNNFSLDKITKLFGDRQYSTVVSKTGMWADGSTYEDHHYNYSAVNPMERKLSLLSADEFIQRAFKPNQFSKLHFDNEAMYLISAAPESMVEELSPPLKFLDKKAFPTFWMSTPGNITHTHNDEREGFLIQIFGTKKVILFDGTYDLFQKTDEEQNKGNENYTAFDNDEEKVFSPLINPELATENEFPGLANLEGYECTLIPGDILYIPFKWWHYVRSIDFSISFNLSLNLVDPIEFEFIANLLKKYPKPYLKVLLKT